MLMDVNLRLSAAQAVTATAVSTNSIDLLQGLALASAGGTYAVPPSQIIGNATYFGEDLGVGKHMGTPRFVFTSGPGTPGAATSLVIGIAGAPDNGGGTIAGLTFVPYIQTRAIPLASILANTRLASIDFPKREVGVALPRFIQAQYTVAGSNFTGLTINADLTHGPDDAVDTLAKYPANY